MTGGGVGWGRWEEPLGEEREEKIAEMENSIVLGR